MTDEHETTESRIAPEFGPKVTPPNRPESLSNRIQGEAGQWHLENDPVTEDARTNIPYAGEGALVAGEQFLGESEHRSAREATGYRTSPFIAKQEE